MSKELTEKEKLVIAERSAAHQLMIQFVKDNACELAFALEELVPFIIGESRLTNLKSDLNTVNITFATVALDVIRSRNETDGTNDPHSLPVDALEMENAIYDLSRFFKMFEPMSSFIELNEEMPAFKMSLSCFSQVDSI